MNRLVLPSLGEGIEKATVVAWHVNIGDEIQPDDDIVEVVTDKAVFNIPANVEGKVVEIKAKEGQEAKIGDVLALIS